MDPSNRKNNKTPKLVQKMQETRYGGYGGIHITKSNNQPQNHFCNTTRDNIMMLMFSNDNNTLIL